MRLIQPRSAAFDFRVARSIARCGPGRPLGGGRGGQLDRGLRRRIAPGLRAAAEAERDARDPDLDGPRSIGVCHSLSCSDWQVELTQRSLGPRDGRFDGVCETSGPIAGTSATEQQSRAALKT